MIGFLAAVAALPAPVIVDPSAFVLDRPMFLEARRDPITDRMTAFAVARTNGARLAVGCDPDEYKGVRVTLTGRMWFAGEKLITGRRLFTFRFDEAPPRRTAWTTDERFAMMHPRSLTANFLGWMIASDELVFRVRDIEGREVDLHFPLEGSREAVEGMLLACRADAMWVRMFGGPALNPAE